MGSCLWDPLGSWYLITVWFAAAWYTDSDPVSVINESYTHASLRGMCVPLMHVYAFITIHCLIRIPFLPNIAQRDTDKRPGLYA